MTLVSGTRRVYQRSSGCARKQVHDRYSAQLYVRLSAPTGSPIADRALAEVAAGPEGSIEDWPRRLRSNVSEINRMALERLIRKEEDERAWEIILLER